MPETDAQSVQDAENVAAVGARAFASSSLGQDVICNAVRGLRCILQLSDHPGVAGMSEASVRHLSRAAAEATPILAEHVDSTLSAERAYLGMGAATGLVALFGKTQEQLIATSTLPLVMDRIDHVVLLAAELDILACRRSIEERGDVLRRLITIRRFADQQMTSDSAIH